MDLSIRLLDQVFMKLIYLMILLMTYVALAEIGSLKYLNIYLFFASIFGIMGKDNPWLPVTRAGKGMGKNSYLCKWVKYFLVGKHISSG